jgi:poly(3-hydroxybutyrate) depolymerase
MKSIHVAICLLFALTASIAYAHSDHSHTENSNYVHAERSTERDTMHFSDQHAAQVFNWHAAEVLGNESAVLVLCPGMNQDGAFFLQESPWMDFAKANNLGVIAIAYESNPDSMYGEARQGYYWPEQGSGKALLDSIQDTYGKDLPILIYGFSGGAHFASRFAEWAPERVIAWAAYSAQFWDSPHASESNPPGIVACGEHDGVRWHPSFSYFYEGRQQNKPWVWVSLPDTGHRRHGAFEQFVRNFFDGVQNATGATAYADVESGELFQNSEDSIQTELLAIFPNDQLIQAWRDVHAF